MIVESITTEEFEMFNFLNKLKDSGTTNMFQDMFQAKPYLMNKFFFINEEQASEVLVKWMCNYSDKGYTHLVVL